MKELKMSPEKLNHLNSHERNLNRRQFVGLGLLSATSALFLSSPFELMANTYASESRGRRKLAYLGFDLVGGASLSGNFLVGKEDGPEDLLKSYSKLGWNPRTAGYDSRFGLPMAKSDVSKLLKGMLETMSPGAQANFRMASFCHVSRDDSSDNPLSIVQLISKIQSTDISRTLKLPIGNLGSTSGGNARSVKELSDFSALKISNLNDIINIPTIPTPLSNHGDDKFKGILKNITGLSRLQAEQFYQDEVIKKSLVNSYDELKGLIGLKLSFDPRIISDVQKIYNLNSNSSVTNNDSIRAGITSATLSHKVGGAVISIAACDYHDGTSTSGDAKDLEIGREIGRAVELAHQRQEPLFIHLFSDGSVFSIENSRKWAGDDGEKSLSVIGLYDPKNVPTYRTKKSFQIGSYTDGQGVDRDTLIGGTPALGSYAVLANYLNAAGMFEQIDEFMPRIFSAQQLEDVIAFNP